MGHVPPVLGDDDALLAQARRYRARCRHGCRRRGRWRRPRSQPTGVSAPSYAAPSMPIADPLHGRARPSHMCAELVGVGEPAITSPIACPPPRHAARSTRRTHASPRVRTVACRRDTRTGSRRHPRPRRGCPAVGCVLPLRPDRRTVATPAASSTASTTPTNCGGRFAGQDDAPQTRSAGRGSARQAPQSSRRDVRRCSSVAAATFGAFIAPPAHSKRSWRSSARADDVVVGDLGRGRRGRPTCGRPAPGEAAATRDLAARTGRARSPSTDGVAREQGTRVAAGHRRFAATASRATSPVRFDRDQGALALQRRRLALRHVGDRARRPATRRSSRSSSGADGRTCQRWRWT